MLESRASFEASWIERHRVSQAGLILMVQEPMVGLAYALGQVDAGAPAKGVQAGDVEPFLWGAVGVAGVEDELALEADDVGDQVGEVGDGEVDAGADVEV
ncbi:hypothetical protein Thiowin_04569 [Thiorhodovibrio winogradskyi]|uniref:Uncharacterized protein n=1 Tax=Thiorhodovibrio winogradskyi TaxID=77007 RepID=A0ABZ0SEU6_9GAMM